MIERQDLSSMNSYYDSEEFKQLALKEDTTYYVKTDMDFLKVHYGFRPGEIHCLMASRGVGKSTLVRGLINDALINNGGLRIGLWLSEEKARVFWKAFSRSSDLRPSGQVLERLKVESENDIKIRGQGSSLRMIFNEFVKDPDLDMIVIDNITTSDMYNNQDSNRTQSDFIDKLKVLAERRNIPIFLVAHTNVRTSSTDLHFPTMEDIRGDKTIINLVQTFWVLTSMSFNGVTYGILRIDKCRAESVEHKNFLMQFSHKHRVIVKAHGIKNLDLEEGIKQEKQRRAEAAKGGFNVGSLLPKH